VSQLSVEIDDSRWPIPCTDIQGSFTPESTDLMIGFLNSFSRREEDYVHVIMIGHYSINMKVMKALGRWQKENRAATAKHCRGVAVCVENIKGFHLVLNTLLSITPTNYPIEVVRSREDAFAWAEKRLKKMNRC